MGSTKWIYVPLIISLVAHFAFFLYTASKKEVDPFQRRIKCSEIAVSSIMFACLIFLFSLPSAAAFEAFGKYAYDVETVRDPQRLAEILREHNLYIARTIEVLRLMIYCFVFPLLTTLLALLNMIGLLYRKGKGEK
ncbi:hypothetical protein [Pyrinomonas methylaliphatogenes]|jgi:hypothetical protein|uniref:Uncharacterized protein n=1 Tax=Pyrinomonas methylaliphatogenes TaxID=454194 RepID=A0A0B6X0I6_9BACT|nr:hypothetical protein [Pyrinomonas methylaliphatogenes]CDM66049.1 hypothetical protein PYK22_02058 [Pyrinomonas methylaliphatogenes]